MNAIDILRKDHESFLVLFKKIDATKDSDENREVWYQQFEYLFTLHTLNEEHLFYPAARELTVIKELIDKSYQSHHIVDMGLKELHTVRFRSSEWKPKFQAIRDAILTHLYEEEDVIFPKAAELIEPGKLEAVGRQILQLRNRLTLKDVANAR